MSGAGIPDKAVEAAKEVAWSRYGSKPDDAYVKALLSAATPHLIAAAWDEGYDRAESDHYETGFWTTRLRANPYRKPTDAD